MLSIRAFGRRDVVSLDMCVKYILDLEVKDQGFRNVKKRKERQKMVHCMHTV